MQANLSSFVKRLISHFRAIMIIINRSSNGSCSNSMNRQRRKEPTWHMQTMNTQNHICILMPNNWKHSCGYLSMCPRSAGLETNNVDPDLKLHSAVLYGLHSLPRPVSPNT